MAWKVIDARRARACRSGERGAELVEFAFVLPLLLFVFAGIIDFGMLMQRYEVVTNAAREGARIASLPGYSAADVQARVTQYVQNGISPSATATAVTTNVTLTVGAGAPTISARQVVVTHTSTYMLLGPIAGIFGGGSFSTITLTARSTMRLEAPGV